MEFEFLIMLPAERSERNALNNLFGVGNK